MDSLFQSLLSLAIVALSFSLFFCKTSSGEFKKKLPPGTTGWPLLGENLRFAMSGPHKFVADRMKKYSSEVFRTSLLGEKMAVFCGPAGNKFLFSNENTLLASWWPASMRRALLFPSSADGNLKEATALLHSCMHEFLKPDALKHYIPVMDSMARDHVASNWIPFEEVKVFPLSKKYTFAAACRLLMNLEDPERIERLAKPFVLVLSGFVSMPLNFPGTPYNRALKGGRMVREELVRIIRERRAEISAMKDVECKDLLTRMLIGTAEKDPVMSEMEISNNIIGLLVAGYDTTSTAVTFVMKYLAELPHVYQKVYEEQMEVAKSKGSDELLDWTDIKKMKYSWNVACETLRLIPPAPGATRIAITDFTYAGFTIPKGWKTFWSVHSTHKNPKYFPEPEKFDPTRFEGTGPTPHTFVPFGGGPRMCPGKEYARIELLVFMHNVVTKFKLQRAEPEEKVLDEASPIPVNGLPVRLHPHQIK